MLTSVAVALVALLAPASAQDAGAEPKKVDDANRPTVPIELQAEIDRAIDRGVQTLIEQQEVDGSWRHDLGGYGPGATGLVAYTLLKCGVPASHPAVVRAFEFMRRRPIDRTYTAATVMMAIGARGDAADKAWMEELTERLVSWQQSGGWGYPDNRPDLSNTQFAGLALRAADGFGVDIKPKVWSKLAEATLDYLEDVGGSSYNPQGFFYERGGEPHPTGSMTSAGLTLVAITLEHVGSGKQALVVAQKRGLLWLAKHLSVDFNPKPGSESGRHGWDHYYLYGLERVGSLFGLESFGDHAWYELGARRLVREQDAHGRWEDSQANTCFALLFLARATGKPKVAVSGGDAKAVRASAERGLFGSDDPLAEVSLRASGTDELTVWVSSFGDRIHRMYAPDDAQRAPLPVKRVEYFIAPAAAPDQATSFATIVADPAAPTPNARFAVQHAPIGPAEYDVFAHITLVDFADNSEVILRSKPMRVKVELSQHPEFLTYATDADRNELRGLTFVTKCSTQMDGEFGPHLATDGLQGTAWRAAATDTAPWLRLEFERPPRAGLLVLTPSHNPAEKVPSCWPTRVRITCNSDEKTAQEVTLHPDPRRKTSIPLPRGLRLRTLHIDLLTRSPGPNGPGLNELELHPAK